MNKSGHPGSGGRPDRHLAQAGDPLAPAFVRKPLHHAVPSWVKPGSLFFVTICCERRDENQLCVGSTGSALLQAAQFYHRNGRWFARLFLLMPDHLHALLALPADGVLSEVVRNWKSYTARRLGVEWQKSFFEHRLRGGEQWELKAEYIRQNPVRKGLIIDAAQWSYVIEN